MRKLLIALLFFALVNVAYSLWSRDHSEDETLASIRSQTRRATQVRSAAAVPATIASQVAPALSTESTKASTPQHPPRPVATDKTSIALPPQRDSSAIRDDHERFLNPYRSGTQVEINGANYDILNLRAVSKDDYRPEMGPVVTEKMNFILIVGSQGLITDTTLPIVARASNGMLGIVTGTFLVKMRNLSDASPVAQSHGLTLKFVDEDIKLAYFSAAPTSSLSHLLAALKADPSVEEASFEVILSHKRF